MSPAPILTVCSPVHAFCKIIRVFVGDMSVLGTSILSGHKIGDTSCSHSCPSVCITSNNWVLLSKLRKPMKLRGKLPVNSFNSHGLQIRKNVVVQINFETRVLKSGKNYFWLNKKNITDQEVLGLLC